MDREVYAPIVSEETMRKLIKKLDDVSLRSQIVDNLTTASDTKALSANMGKKLQDEKLSIANLASTLGQQTNTAPTNKAVDDAISSLNDAINAILDWKLFNTYTILVGDSFPTEAFPTGWKEAMFVVYAEGSSIACSIVICKNAWEALPNNCYVKSGYYHDTENGDLYILKKNNTTYALRRAFINEEYKDTKVRVYYR